MTKERISGLTFEHNTITTSHRVDGAPVSMTRYEAVRAAAKRTMEANLPDDWMRRCRPPLGPVERRRLAYRLGGTP